MSPFKKNKEFQPPSTQELGELLPSFEIISLVDRDGIGAVFHANQTSLERDVAIKILPEEFGEDLTFREGFKVQAQAMAKLSHPNLVAIYDFGEVGKMLYIVMEYASENTLMELCNERRLEHVEVASIASKIAKGLLAAHDSGITHQNLTPKSILLTDKHVPKVSDFGIRDIQLDKDDEDSFESSGYCAPEVVKDQSAAGEQSDIFSLGVMIYEMLTKCLPAKNYAAASDLVDANEDFDNIIRKAIHPNPSMRYSSVKSLSKDLEELFYTLEDEYEGSLTNQTSPFVTSSTAANVIRTNTTSAHTLRASSSSAHNIRTSNSAPQTLRSSQSNADKLQAPITGANKLRTDLNSATSVPTGGIATQGHMQQPAAPVVARPKVNIPNKKANNILINIFILIVLAVAGYGAWAFIKATNAENQRVAERNSKNRELDRKESESGLVQEARRKRAAEAARGNDKDLGFGSSGIDVAISDSELKSRNPEEIFELEAKERTSHEDALKQLEQEQINLLNGIINKDGLPNNTFVRDQNFYLYINKKMTWHEADAFCTSFGGQIATCSQLADLAFLKKHADKLETFWIGGGATPRGIIEHIDNTPFKIEVPAVFAGKALSYSGGAEASLANPNHENTFFIEWSVKGESNSSVDARLARLYPTLDSLDPRYPPLAYSDTSHNYAVVYKTMTFEEAKQLARNAGGHLAVISESKEHIALSRYLTDSIKPDAQLWAGYEPSADGTWTTVTPEPEALTPWMHDLQVSASEGGACVLDEGKVKILRTKESKLDGCVIEWSDDEEKAYKLSFLFNTSGSSVDVKEQAQKMINSEVFWHEYHSSNIPRRLSWILKTRRNSGTKSERAKIGPELDTVIDEINALNGIPAELKVESLPRDIRDQVYAVIDEQTELDKQHDKQLTVIKDGYTYQLRNIYNDFQDKQDPLALRVLEEGKLITSSSPEEFKNHISE